ncbi:MAG TPA: ssDNA-binding protein, partial [Methanosarcina sp.]|nr:ssDNA-binding protein [Methanosarcina sp.]
TEEEKKFWYQKFTLKGRMFFPELLEPKVGSNGRLKYELLFGCKYNEPANQAEIQRIGQFLMQAKQKYHATIPDQFWGNPVKKFDTYIRQDGKPNHEFLRDCYFFNASSGKDMPPIVVNSMRQPVIDKAEVYSGRNCVVNISFWLNDGGKDGTGKKGVGVNISAVMLLDGGEKEGGQAQVNINEVFGAFANDMGMNNQPMPYSGQPQAQPTQPQATQQTYNPSTAQGWNPNGQGNNGGFI